MIKVTIKGTEYEFKATAQLGTFYRYEKIFGKPYEYKSGDFASLVELFFAVLMNDNPDSVIDYSDYIQELDNIFQAMSEEYVKVQKARQPIEKEEVKKKRATKR